MVLNPCISLLTSLLLIGWPCLLHAADISGPSAQDTNLYALYLARDYFALEAQMVNLSLGEKDRLFFEGQIDAAHLQDKAAEEKLQKFLTLSGMDADWRKEAWLTMGNIQLRHGDYPNAALNLAHALDEPHAQFTAEERINTEQNLALARVLHGMPPQTRIDHEGSCTVNTTRSEGGENSGGRILVDVQVNGLTEQAIFDTGSNLSIASESYARRHRLQLLDGALSLMAGTNQTVSAQAAFANEVKVGKMTFRNVIFDVLKDESSVAKSNSAKLDVIMGLPLIIALAHLRLAPDGNSMEVGLPPEPFPVPRSMQNLALDRFCPILLLGYQNNCLPFALDTGMSQTLLLPKFIQRFPSAFDGITPSTKWQKSIGGTVAFSVQVVPQFEITVNGAPMVLRNVLALQQNMLAFPAVLGVVGQDLLRNGFELDFEGSRFSIVK